LLPRIQETYHVREFLLLSCNSHLSNTLIRSISQSFPYFMYSHASYVSSQMRHTIHLHITYPRTLPTGIHPRRTSQRLHYRPLWFRKGTYRICAHDYFSTHAGLSRAINT
jgi:hypothetical protein